MALGKRLFTGGAAACLTETTDIFGDSSGKLLYSFDTDASDASGVYNGTPTDVDFGVSGKINTGVRFPQTTSQRIQFTNPISNASNADFNVSFFVKFRSITGTAPNFAYVIVGNPANQYGPFQIYTYYHASGLVFMLQRSVSGSVYYSTNYDTDIPVSVTANTYHHISINYTASSYGIEIFKDGVSAGTSTLDQAAVLTQLNTSSLGYNDSNAANALAGSLDQFRIFSRKLTGSEITTLVGETACVHTSTTDNNDFPVTNAAYYKLDNSSVDSHSGTFDGTESNVEYRFGRYGQAAVFNGSNSIITATQPSGINGPCSYSIWLKTTSSSYQSIITVGSVTGSHTAGVNLFVNSGKLSCQTGNGSNTENTTLNSTSNVDTGNWVHCVVTVAGSTQGSAIKIYVNGVNETSGTANNTAIVTATGEKLCLGGRILSGSQSTFLNGSLDQARIFTTELSQANVTSLYNEKPETDTSNFKAVLWNANGASNYISNVGMDLETSGGLVWTKARNQAYNHSLYDSVRGVNKLLQPNKTSAESPVSDALNSFEANGFFLGGSDNSNDTSGGAVNSVGWVWKSGGAAVSNGNGSITSSVSANTAAGFSNVSYTGNNTSGATVGHGLSSIPELMIVKRRNATSDWDVYSSATGNQKYLILDTDQSELTASNIWNNTSPTDSVFTIGNHSSVNASGGTYISYIFHSVAGYSKISSYSGSGGSGNVQTVGFRPSLVVIKRTNTGGAGSDHWLAFTSNVLDASGNINMIRWDTNQTEFGSQRITFQDTSFTLTDADASRNATGGNYLYIAFK